MHIYSTKEDPQVACCLFPNKQKPKPSFCAPSIQPLRLQYSSTASAKSLRCSLLRPIDLCHRRNTSLWAFFPRENPNNRLFVLVMLLLGEHFRCHLLLRKSIGSLLHQVSDPLSLWVNAGCKFNVICTMHRDVVRAFRFLPNIFRACMQLSNSGCCLSSSFENVSKT